MSTNLKTVRYNQFYYAIIVNKQSILLFVFLYNTFFFISYLTAIKRIYLPHFKCFRGSALAIFKKHEQTCRRCERSEAMQHQTLIKLRSGLLRYRSQRPFVKQFYKNGQSREEKSQIW